MAQVDIAVVKNGVVVNCIVIEEELVDTPEELEAFRIAEDADELVFTGFTVQIGSTYDSKTKIMSKPVKPFENWVWSVHNRWEPPIEYPSDGKLYNWNQEENRWDIEDQEAIAASLRAKNKPVNPILDADGRPISD